MTFERSKDLKLERDKQRFFASELIDAVRGRHINVRWIPVSFEDTWGWLTHSWAQGFVEESSHFRRIADIIKEQAKMATELLGAAQVLPYT